jgi:hypothetical protein
VAVIPHRFPRGFMPVTDPVRCEACGVEMRRTGLTFPHVVFRAPMQSRWSRVRPACLPLWGRR